ncbi:MAG TPA: hypothetical protein DCM67_06790 [Propionibacteriaceae bacterium]|nr:hypothetical protein [Propionibacteriaceae bacterium]
MITATKMVGIGIASALVLSGCSSATDTVQAVGTVTDQAQTVQIPALDAPTVNLDAGFPAAAPTATDAGDQLGSSTTATTFGLGNTWQIATVLVSVGDSVQVGQPVATLDQTQLDLQVNVARADADVATAQVDLLTAAIGDTYSKAAEVATNRDKVRDAIATLTATQADLKKKKAQLRTTRAELTTQLDQVNAALKNPMLPPQQKAQLTAARTQLLKGIATIDAALTQITQAEPQLSRGLTKARSGLATLTTAAATITDARTQLTGLRDLARIAADTAKLSVDLAKVHRDQAVLTSPVTGVVVTIAHRGDRLAPGATVAEIRPVGASEVTTWLPPQDAAAVCVGNTATITGDWMAPGQSVPARLDWVAATADYPPTSTTTGDVHLLRAVEVQLSSNAELPAGVGVEITINGCPAGSDQNK